MRTFTFEIILPDAAGKKIETSSVTLYTRAGQITLLAGHADLITLTEKGKIAIKTDAGELSLYAEAGMLYVSGGNARLLTDKANEV